MAFLFLEAQLREEWAEAETDAEDAATSSRAALQYIVQTRAAANKLLPGRFEWVTIPNRSAQISLIQDTLYDMHRAVDDLTIGINIEKFRRDKRYTATFDASTKQKLRHLISKIKEIVDTLDVDQKKKEAILAKATALEAEIDRNRVRFDVAMDLMLETNGATGEAAKKLNPLADLIGRMLGYFKTAQDEERPTLPAPPKRLEPPAKQLPAPDEGQE